jgi:hypothetical protein
MKPVRRRTALTVKIDNSIGRLLVLLHAIAKSGNGRRKIIHTAIVNTKFNTQLPLTALTVQGFYCLSGAKT